MATERELRRRIRSNLAELRRSEVGGRGYERLREQILADRNLLREMERGVDYQTGIPAEQRALLGAAQSPAEEQAVMAQQYGQGNVRQGEGGELLVRPDPTGPWTAVNPPGMDMGDIAALTDPALRTMGGVVGSLGGGMVGGPPGAIAGAGLGEAALGQVSNELLRPTYEPTLGQRARDIGVDAALGSAGDVLGSLAGMLGRGVMRGTVGTTEQAAPLAAAYTRQGIPPANRAALIPNRLNRSLVGATEANPLTGQYFIQRAQQQTDDAFEQRMAELTRGGETRLNAGTQARQAMGDYATARRVAEGDPFSQFSEAMRETPVPLTATQGFLQGAAERVEEPIVGALAYSNPMLERMSREAAETPRATANWNTLQRARGELGQQLDQPAMAGRTAAEGEMRRLYGAMTEDAENALEAMGLRDQYQAARQAYRAMKDELQRLDQNFPENVEPEQVIDRIISVARTSPSRAAEIRTAIEGGNPEAWRSVQAAILNDLSRGTPGQIGRRGETTSMQTFVTNLERLGRGTDRDNALTALFGAPGDPLRDNVDDLLQISISDRQAREMINQSRTANAIGMGLGYGGVGSGLALGSSIPVAPLLASNITAMWLTRPGFVRRAARLAEETGSDRRLFERLLPVVFGQAGVQPAREPIISAWEQEQQGPDVR